MKMFNYVLRGQWLPASTGVGSNLTLVQFVLTQLQEERNKRLGWVRMYLGTATDYQVQHGEEFILFGVHSLVDVGKFAQHLQMLYLAYSF